MKFCAEVNYLCADSSFFKFPALIETKIHQRKEIKGEKEEISYEEEKII